MTSENELLLEGNYESKKEKQCSEYMNLKGCAGILIIIVQCMCEIGSISCLQVIRHLPPNFELNTLRFAIGLVLVIIYLVLSWQLPLIQRDLTGWVLLGVLATFFYNLTLYSEYVKKLPIGAVFGIKQGFYILLVAMATRILLKQKHSWLKVALMLMTWIGIGIVILSSFLPKSENMMKHWSNCNNWNHTSISQEDSNKLLKDEAAEHTKNLTLLQKDCSAHLTGYTTDGVLISITLIFTGMLCATVENLTISGTSLKDVNGIFLSFWYFLFGSISSILTSITFENMFIPEKLTDKIYSVVHCTLASVVTFLCIFALKLLEPNILAIIYSIQIPLALITQMFLVQLVTPPVDLWVLILGLVIITLSVFMISMTAVCLKANDP